MFIIPIGDDNPTGRKPYVTYALLIINVLVFLLLGFRHDYHNIVNQYGYVPDLAVPYTYITSLFLHGGLGHLVGNMLYLYIAGDNVEDKLGHAGFLIFYLACGAASDFAHGRMAPPAMMNIPVIGASGAISAVLGAYMLLFPKNKIKFFYFVWILIFIRWGTFFLQSFWAIGAWFVLQLLSHASSGASSVAYGAHIGGFIGGALIMGILALLGVVKAHWQFRKEQWDVEMERENRGEYLKRWHRDDFGKPPHTPDNQWQNYPGREDDYR